MFRCMMCLEVRLVDSDLNEEFLFKIKRFPTGLLPGEWHLEESRYPEVVNVFKTVEDVYVHIHEQCPMEKHQMDNLVRKMVAIEEL